MLDFTEYDPEFLTVEQVAHRLAVSVHTIYRWKRQGSFPEAMKMSHGTTRWHLSDIREWESALQVGFATQLAPGPAFGIWLR